MSKVEIASAFVEEQVGNPTFVLKCAEPHSKKDDQGNWQTVARTFFDLKVGRESGIDLAQFGKGARIKVWGNQRTEVREHDGKKFYSLVVWADRIEVAQAAGGGNGGGSGAGAAGQPQQGWDAPVPASEASGNFAGGFDDEQPF